MVQISIEKRKELFKDLAHLIVAMENFENENSEKNKLKLDILLLTKENIILPSGKWGNALALALEMHKFKTANYILENKEKFNISLDYIAFELDKVGAAIHFEDELEFSLSYFDYEKAEMNEYSKMILNETTGSSKDKYNEIINAIENLKCFKRFKR